MLFLGKVSQTVTALVCLASQLALARPRAGYVTLINATPYDWKLISNHFYQVEWDFPGVIKAGTSQEQYVKFKKDHHDDGAEAVYSLEKSPSPASFIVKARAPKHIEIQFQESLTTLNNPMGSTINLGFVENGAVSFVLSGDTGSYISSNPPITWMQATLSNIETKSLREVALPASHDAGMSEVSWSWSGHPHNTQTQTTTIYHQLINGARVFDIRPTYSRKKFYAGHFSKFGSGMVGGTGRKITDIVKNINAFTDQYPGELIILDISHAVDATERFRDLSPWKWGRFFEEMNKIQALWIPSSSNIPNDLSKTPLSTFIKQRSNSAVLVRFSDGTPLPETGITPHVDIKRKMTAFKSAARMNYIDDMMPQGPALESNDIGIVTATDDTEGRASPRSSLSDDDYDEAASKTTTTIPTISILPTNRRAGMNLEDSTSEDTSPTPDVIANSLDLGNIATVTDFPSAIGVVSLPDIPSSLSEPIIPSLHSPGTYNPAFIHASRLQVTGSYSNTEKPSQLISDQLSKLASLRPSPHSPIHKSVWTITQKKFIHITDVANRKTSVTGLAIYAHRALLGHLWDGMSKGEEGSWPSLIEIDDFKGSRVTSLCMVSNDYFVKERNDHERRMVMRRRQGKGRYSRGGFAG